MYEEYLKTLLEPLGVYNLEETALNRAEIYALGKELDVIGEKLETTEKEALVMTAENAGLSRRETLFTRRPAAETAKERRAAISALFQINGDSLTPRAINRTMRGCGIRARAQEVGEGTLRVIFPACTGVPAEFEQIEKIILDIIPCHLAVEFYFRYLTWEECHKTAYTWADVENAEHTWESFQLAVPPEPEEND